MNKKAKEVSREVPTEEIYDFNRIGHIGPEQLRALNTMQEQFARHLSHTLGAWLRTQFLATLQQTEQKSFAVFLASLSEAVYVTSLRLEPLGAYGALALDLQLVSPMVDVLLGGSGRATEVRDLTEIEESIVFAVTEMMTREFNNAWNSTGLSCVLEKREREGQLQRLMGPAEKTITLTFEIVMPEAAGNLILCLPAVVLSPILRKMMTQHERHRRRSAEARQRIEASLAQAEVSVLLQLPPMRLAAREVLHLHEGQLLRFTLPQNTLAELRIGGVAISRAYLVSTGEHRGAQIIGSQSLSMGPINKQEANT